MNIVGEKDGAVFRLRLDGRLDASWCDQVAGTIEQTIRSGEHHLRLEMSEVHYLSSAGIRLLLSTYKKLKGIGGSMFIENPAPSTEKVLRMGGLVALLATAEKAVPTAKQSTVRAVETDVAQFEFYPVLDGAQSIYVEGIGETASLGKGATGSFTGFQSPSVLIGVGALGHDGVDAAQRMGELIAVNGNVAYQPTDGANQPDFMVPHGDIRAEGQLLVGLSGSAVPESLVRFEAGASSVIQLSELADTILKETGADAAVIVAVTETAGLVGTTLRQSPAKPREGGERFDFPGIRDWLSFSNERIHRDSTSLVVGFVSRPGSAIDAWLRPIDKAGNLLGHLHAAVFPYHPLRKGQIELGDTVDAMFSDQRLLSVLHLLSDQRGLVGAGESQFYRGACWYAPITFAMTEST